MNGQEQKMSMIKIATRKTGVKDLVSVMGSIACGKRYWSGNELAPDIMSAMLLSGTKSRDKKSLNDALENASLALSFSIDSDYLHLATTVPKGKEKLFIEIIADILANSVFPKDEFTIIVERTRAGILESSTDPDDVAWRALTRAYFPKGAIQYKLSAEDRLKLLDTLTLQDVIKAYKELVGLSEINIAIAGDVDEKLWHKEINASFSKLPKKTHKFIPNTAIITPEKNSQNINIKDKTSVNAYWATPIIIDVNSREFRAMKCILRVLGGDFISRLMSEVRIKRGLTYSIDASIQGVTHGDTGLLYIDATFAPVLHEKGITATEEVLKNLFDKGVKLDELERVKNAISGSYEVNSATSIGMASELLNCLELGRPVTYIEEFPKLIASVNMEEIKKLLIKLKPQRFYRVSAGSI